MSYYSSWNKKKINCNSNGLSINAPVALQADLTPAQITVCTINDKFVYNMEYKPTTPVEDNSQRRVRQSTTCTTSSSTSSASSASNSSNTFAAANVFAAKFQNHSRNHSKRHTRRFSSESEAVSIMSEDSMWDDWLIKFINEDKKAIAADDSPMEEWIFETM